MIQKRKKADIVADMRKMGYTPIPKLPKKPDETGPAEDEDEEEVPDAALSVVGQKDSGTCLLAFGLVS